MNISPPIFRRRFRDEYQFVYGSANRADRFYRFLRIRAKTVDRAGHCTLHFEFDLNQEEPNEGRAVFSLRVEPWTLAALGILLRELHGNPSGEFHWSPNHGGVRPT